MTRLLEREREVAALDAVIAEACGGAAPGAAADRIRAVPQPPKPLAAM
jgi:hypothetical protein